MKSGFTREQEIKALSMLSSDFGIERALIEKRWQDVLVAVEFARNDPPPELANTDPRLFRQIRGCVTRFLLRGGRVFNTDKLRQLAESSQLPSRPCPPISSGPSPSSPASSISETN